MSQSVGNPIESKSNVKFIYIIKYCYFDKWKEDNLDSSLGAYRANMKIDNLPCKTKRNCVFDL